MNGKKPGKVKPFMTYGAAMLAILMWAVNMPATRLIVQYYGFGSLALFRFLVGAVCLVIVAAFQKSKLPSKKDLPLFIIAGFIGIFAFTIFLNIGALYVVSGIASFVINSSPVWTLILAGIFLKERVKPACWIGIMISFAGLMGIMIAQTAEFSLNIGIFLLFFASVSLAIYNVLQRKLYLKYTFFEATTYTIVAGSVFFLIFIPDLIRDWSAGFPMYTHIIVILMGIFPAAASYLAWGYALATAEKTPHVTAFLYLTPFLSTLIAFLWLGETFSVWSLLGGAVIVGGMILTNTLGKSK